MLGEPGRLAGVTWDAEVAWCRSVGGAVAIAFALARLAAIAAATLDFFAGFGVVGGMEEASSGLGQTFSTSFRAISGKLSSMAALRSLQTSLKLQKANLAAALTPALASLSDFLIPPSKTSTPPEASMACFAR